MTREEKQRGLELQGYIDSIRDMTIKEIAIKHLKKYHLPKFLASLLVKFSTPLLLAKDYELTELKEKISVLLSCKNCSENKGGLICQKEYENKCLAQKIEYIKELQEENAELKADNDARKFAMAMSEKVEKQLREENAELQQKWLNESYEKAKLVEKWKHNGENIIQECKDIEGAKTYYEHQLTKAKELLAKWVELFKPKGGNIPPTPIQVDTEQFLKNDGCPDVMCEDCTKEDCGVRQLGLVEVEK